MNKKFRIMLSIFTVPPTICFLIACWTAEQPLSYCWGYTGLVLSLYILANLSIWAFPEGK